MYSHQSERAILGNALLFASSRPALILCDVGSTELPSPEQSWPRTHQLLQGLGLGWLKLRPVATGSVLFQKHEVHKAH